MITVPGKIFTKKNIKGVLKLSDCAYILPLFVGDTILNITGHPQNCSYISSVENLKSAICIIYDNDIDNSVLIYDIKQLVKFLKDKRINITCKLSECDKLTEKDYNWIRLSLSKLIHTKRLSDKFKSWLIGNCLLKYIDLPTTCTEIWMHSDEFINIEYVDEGTKYVLSIDIDEFITDHVDGKNMVFSINIIS